MLLHIQKYTSFGFIITVFSAHFSQIKPSSGWREPLRVHLRLGREAAVLKARWVHLLLRLTDSFPRSLSSSLCWCPGLREQIAGTSETGGDSLTGSWDTRWRRVGGGGGRGRCVVCIFRPEDDCFLLFFFCTHYMYMYMLKYICIYKYICVGECVCFFVCLFFYYIKMNCVCFLPHFVSRA